MKAAVYERYGAPEVLQVREIEKPNPAPNEVLIKIHATAATAGDARLRKADPFAVRFIFGLFAPKKKILGDGFSGEVEAVGAQVTRFKPGDLVFGTSSMQFGSYAEYKCLPETGVISLKPAGISHEAAATIHFGAATALFFIQKADIKPGQKVLVYGASGAIGTAAVQLAKTLGAEVTAVCSSPNHPMVQSIGADHVIDYRVEDFTRRADRYDVIFDAVGKAPLRGSFNVLKKGGVLLQSAAMMQGMLQGKILASFQGKKAIAGVAVETAQELQTLKALMEAGKIKSVIGKTFTLDQIAEAHRYIDTGHKVGNVAIQVAGI